MSLLNCAPCVPSRLRALPIIDTRLTHLRVYAPYQSLMRLRAYAPLPSSIGALGAFVLSCAVVLQLKIKVRAVCELHFTIHPSSVTI